MNFLISLSTAEGIGKSCMHAPLDAKTINLKQKHNIAKKVDNKIFKTRLIELSSIRYRVIAVVCTASQELSWLRDRSCCDMEIKMLSIFSALFFPRFSRLHPNLRPPLNGPLRRLPSRKLCTIPFPWLLSKGILPP